MAVLLHFLPPRWPRCVFFLLWGSSIYVPHVVGSIEVDAVLNELSSDTEVTSEGEEDSPSCCMLVVWDLRSALKHGGPMAFGTISVAKPPLVDPLASVL